MKLLKLQHRYDFGHDYYAQVLTIKDWSLLQVSVSWTDCSSWPYVQITSGQGRVVSLLFWAYKFGLDVDILSRTWKWYYEQETELD